MVNTKTLKLNEYTFQAIISIVAENEEQARLDLYDEMKANPQHWKIVSVEKAFDY